jgi:myo-inositol-1(or 4)-monophosphatase
MTRAAEKAARSLIRDFGEVENLQVSRKGPGDFVSAADRRAEEIIKDVLSQARPDFAFLMEESGKSGDDDAENRWIVDPLDGTTNFLHGLPHWAISIALESKGEIISGLIFDPVKNEMYRAEKGLGAFLKNRRMRVSGRRDSLDAIIATGQPKRDYERRAKFLEETRAVYDEFPAMRRFGAAALDLAYVASGRYDGFWERELNPWDVAAGILMVKESGGFVSDIDGNANPVYSKTIVAANEAFHQKLRNLVA